MSDNAALHQARELTPGGAICDVSRAWHSAVPKVARPLWLGCIYARLAQSVERKALNLVVVGSSQIGLCARPHW